MYCSCKEPTIEKKISYRSWWLSALPAEEWLLPIHSYGPSVKVASLIINFCAVIYSENRFFCFLSVCYSFKCLHDERSAGNARKTPLMHWSVVEFSWDFDTCYLVPNSPCQCHHECLMFFGERENPCWIHFPDMRLLFHHYCKEYHFLPWGLNTLKA